MSWKTEEKVIVCETIKTSELNAMSDIRLDLEMGGKKEY